MKEKTNLQSYCVDLLDVSACFERLLRANNWGEKLCTLQFPPCNKRDTAHTQPILFILTALRSDQRQGGRIYSQRVEAEPVPVCANGLQQSGCRESGAAGPRC